MKDPKNGACGCGASEKKGNCHAAALPHLRNANEHAGSAGALSRAAIDRIGTSRRGGERYANGVLLPRASNDLMPPANRVMQSMTNSGIALATQGSLASQQSTLYADDHQRRYISMGKRLQEDNGSPPWPWVFNITKDLLPTSFPADLRDGPCPWWVFIPPCYWICPFEGLGYDDCTGERHAWDPALTIPGGWPPGLEPIETVKWQSTITVPDPEEIAVNITQILKRHDPCIDRIELRRKVEAWPDGSSCTLYTVVVVYKKTPDCMLGDPEETIWEKTVCSGEEPGSDEQVTEVKFGEDRSGMSTMGFYPPIHIRLRSTWSGRPPTVTIQVYFGNRMIGIIAFNP